MVTLFSRLRFIHRMKQLNVSEDDDKWESVFAVPVRSICVHQASEVNVRHRMQASILRWNGLEFQWKQFYFIASFRLIDWNK